MSALRRSRARRARHANGTGNAKNAARGALATLHELHDLLPRFDSASAARKLQLLRALRRPTFDRAQDLIQLQRIACFLRAFPDNDAVHRAARRLAIGFAARVQRLPRGERDTLDDSASAGTTTRNVYSAAAALWLVARFPQSVDIDWKAFDCPEALGTLVQPLLDPLEDENTEFDRASVRRWLAEAKGASDATDLAWLLAQRPPGGPGAVAFDRDYDAAEVPLAWQIGAGRAAMTNNALAQPIATRARGTRRPAADSRAAITQPLAAITLLAPRAARRVLDVWRAAIWARTRTVFQMEQAEFGACFVADFGMGVSMAVVGVRPDKRTALEVNYGYLLLANGMPIGYGGFTALFHQINTGINVFPEYRGAEAAFIFEQALRAMHTLTGCARVVINPYQIGAGNDEALASGSYWFYYRLGFRSADAGLRRLAEQEFARLRERGYRVPLRTLRRLAGADIHLDLNERAGETFFNETWLAPIARGITGALAREGSASRALALRQMTRRLATMLDIDWARWSARERRGFEQFAPILAQIDDVAAWPAGDKHALAALCRARWSTDERDFIARMRAHDRLRVGLADVARRALGRASPRR